jgi:hypothetical protein
MFFFLKNSRSFQQVIIVARNHYMNVFIYWQLLSVNKFEPSAITPARAILIIGVAISKAGSQRLA